MSLNKLLVRSSADVLVLLVWTFFLTLSQHKNTDQKCKLTISHMFHYLVFSENTDKKIKKVKFWS